jgi:hypothetical protein
MNHIEEMKQALKALESCTPGDYSTGHVIFPSYDEQAVEQAMTTLRTAIEAVEKQEPVALEALAMICVKCRSNEWGPDTPRKEILNWFHDFASKALEDATPPAAPVQEPVALPMHETEEMHDAVMSVLYQGVSRGNTDALWQAYRKVLVTTPPAAPVQEEDLYDLAMKADNGGQP